MDRLHCSCMSEGERDASAEETAFLMAFLLFLNVVIIPESSSSRIVGNRSALNGQHRSTNRASDQMWV